MAGTAKGKSQVQSNDAIRFPSEETLRRMRKKLSRAKGSLALPPNADLLDKSKYELCKQFVKHCQEHGITQRQLAAMIGANESRVSEIVHYHIHKLTLDRLVKYLEKIKPKAEVKVA